MGGGTRSLLSQPPRSANRHNHSFCGCTRNRVHTPLATPRKAVCVGLAPLSLVSCFPCSISSLTHTLSSSLPQGLCTCCFLCTGYAERSDLHTAGSFQSIRCQLKCHLLRVAFPDPLKAAPWHPPPLFSIPLPSCTSERTRAHRDPACLSHCGIPGARMVHGREQGGLKVYPRNVFVHSFLKCLQLSYYIQKSCTTVEMFNMKTVL